MSEIPMRHPKRKPFGGNGLLYLGQVIIFIMRPVLFVAELLASGPKRSRLHSFRQQMQAMDRAKGEMLSQVKRDPTTALDHMDAFMERFGDDEVLADQRDLRAKIEGRRRMVHAPLDLYLRHRTDPAAAVAALEQYRDEHPEDYHAWSTLATALWEAGQQDGGIAAMREAVRWADTGAEYGFEAPMHRLQLATLLSKKGNQDEAAAEFRRIITSAPDDAEVAVGSAYLSLGDLCRDTGDMTAARQAWGMAARWDTTGILKKEARTRLAAIP